MDALEIDVADREVVRFAHSLKRPRNRRVLSFLLDVPRDKPNEHRGTHGHDDERDDHSDSRNDRARRHVIDRAEQDAADEQHKRSGQRADRVRSRLAREFAPPQRRLTNDSARLFDWSLVARAFQRLNSRECFGRRSTRRSPQASRDVGATPTSTVQPRSRRPPDPRPVAGAVDVRRRRCRKRLPHRTARTAGGRGDRRSKPPTARRIVTRRTRFRRAPAPTLGPG
jgi:hypothetical protein